MSYINRMRSHRPTWARSRVVLSVLVLLGCFRAQAHRLDELLQSTFLTIGTQSITLEVNLAPGVSLAPDFLASIDVDHDGSLSLAEQTAFADGVVRSLVVTIEGTSRPLRLEDQEFSTTEEIKEGTGLIRVRAITSVEPVSLGLHQLHFRNRFREDQGQNIYLVNTLVPTNAEIRLIRQLRDPFQKEMELHFERSSESSPLISWGPFYVTLAAAWLTIAAAFFRVKRS